MKFLMISLIISAATLILVLMYITSETRKKEMDQQEINNVSIRDVYSGNENVSVNNSKEED